MRKPLIAAAAVVAWVVAGATTVGAINTYNAQPAPERDEVGAYVALWDSDDDAVADRFDWVCSGTMVDLDTFLTAGHCTTETDWPEGTRHFITLEDDFQSLLDGATGTAPQQAAQFLLDELIVEGDPFTEAGYPGNGAMRTTSGSSTSATEPPRRRTSGPSPLPRSRPSASSTRRRRRCRRPRGR